MLIEKYVIIINDTPYKVFLDKEKAKKSKAVYGDVAKMRTYYGNPDSTSIQDYLIHKPKNKREMNKEPRCLKVLEELALTLKNYNEEKIKK